MRPPLPDTPIFGRESNLAHALELLGQPLTRLLTLTGAGGTGKSRLAVELAHEVGGAYTNLWFVDLTTIGDANAVPSAIAQAAGVQEGGSKPLGSILQELLADQPSLVLL